jgi:hypothetical protein
MFKKKIKNRNCPFCRYSSYLIKPKKVLPATEEDTVCVTHYLNIDIQGEKEKMYWYFGICIYCNKFIWRNNPGCPNCEKVQKEAIKDGKDIEDIRKYWFAK